ncbi:MAG: PRC-barrel domain-containing protein [Patescibacteria group bacterium]|jgi:uncharacterized protein YrrD
MLKAISEVVGSRLVDLDKSQAIGEVVNWVVNPDERKLSALVVRLNGLFPKNMLVTTADIIEYGPQMVVVKNQLSVVTPDEVVGMPKLLKSKFRLIGGRVETKSRKLIGQVEDIMFETTDSSLQKLYVKPNLLGLVTRPDVIIGIDRVLLIEPRRIIVEDDVAEPIAPGQTVRAEV